MSLPIGPMVLIPKGAPLRRENIVLLPKPKSYQVVLGGDERVVFLTESHHYTAPKIRIASLTPFLGEWGIGQLGLECFRAQDQGILDRFQVGGSTITTLEKHLEINWGGAMRGTIVHRRRARGKLPLSYASVVDRAVQNDIHVFGVNHEDSRWSAREKKIVTRIRTLSQRAQRRRDEKIRLALHMGAFHGMLDPAWAAGMVALGRSVLSVRFISRAVSEPQRVLNAIIRAGLGDTEFAIPGMDVGLSMYHWIVYLPNHSKDR